MWTYLFRGLLWAFAGIGGADILEKLLGRGKHPDVPIDPVQTVKSNWLRWLIYAAGAVAALHFVGKRLKKT